MLSLSLKPRRTKAQIAIDKAKEVNEKLLAANSREYMRKMVDMEHEQAKMLKQIEELHHELKRVKVPEREKMEIQAEKPLNRLENGGEELEILGEELKTNNAGN